MNEQMNGNVNSRYNSQNDNLGERVQSPSSQNDLSYQKEMIFRAQSTFNKQTRNHLESNFDTESINTL